MPRRSRVTVLVHDQVRRQPQVATRVQARTGRVVAEQSLAFDGSEGTTGVTLSLGTVAPARSWSLPFGAAADGRTHTVAVANFSDNATEAEVSMHFEDEDAVEPQIVPVPGRTVVNVDVAAVVPIGSEYSVDVRATGSAPVVAEELITAVSSSESGAALDLGLPDAARRWAFAGVGESAAVGDADTLVSVFNPSDDPVTVTLLAYTSGDLNSPRSAPERAVDAGGRTTFTLSELGIGPDQVLVVDANGPVFSERVLLTATGRSVAGGIAGRS